MNTTRATEPHRMNARNAIVVAFDGLVADTLHHRTTAVVEGIAAVGFTVNPNSIRDIVAGRTLAESVRLAFAMAGLDVDETTFDIATYRATKFNAMSMRQPINLLDGALPWLERASVSSRLIIRADSERSHVDAVLHASGLSDNVSLLLCSDDIETAGTESPMLLRAWRIISARCAAQGTAAEHLHGLECASIDQCSKVDAARIHRVTSITEVALDTLQLF